MSDEQINAAIATSLGRTYHKPTEEELKTGSYYQYEPNYAGDLNAIHHAEAWLHSHWEEQKRYVRTLSAICLDAKHSGESSEFATLNATARQRAEAYLRTIGKWEE